MRTLIVCLVLMVGCSPKGEEKPKIDSVKTEPSPRKNPLDTLQPKAAPNYYFDTLKAAR